eukprot:2007821-Rhodomonas_salina.3
MDRGQHKWRQTCGAKKAFARCEGWPSPRDNSTWRYDMRSQYQASGRPLGDRCARPVLDAA